MDSEPSRLFLRLGTFDQIAQVVQGQLVEVARKLVSAARAARAPDDPTLVQNLQDVHQEREREPANLSDLAGGNDFVRVFSQISKADQGVVGFFAQPQHRHTKYRTPP